MPAEMPVFNDSFDLVSTIEAVHDNGYCFRPDSLTRLARSALESEINSLPLEVGDHIANPINTGKPNVVKQQHARAYFGYGTEMTAVANLVIDSLTDLANRLGQYPELSNWQLNEIGYQRYRSNVDFIGPHRDRGSDQLLSLTFTIRGSALVKIFEAMGDYWDYSQIRQTDEFLTEPGTTMLLRAPGFGNGEQVIHQVLPPTSQVRDILNLRMRPTILEQPSHPRWQPPS